MRIFSNISLQFDHPQQAAEPVVVQHQSFVDVPDWVAESTMFKLALADGSITVIESKQDEVQAQYGGGKDKSEKGRQRTEANAPDADQQQS